MISNAAELVASILAGEDAGIEELYRLCTAGSLAYYLYRRIGAQAEDISRDVFLSALDSIQRGQLREPNCLPAFLRTIARRAVAACIRQAVANRRRNEGVHEMAVYSVRDHRPNPEQGALDNEQAERIARTLTALPARDRDVLVRFYIAEQPKEQIMADLALNDTQFRLLKSRALGKFATAGEEVFGVTRIVAMRLREAGGSRAAKETAANGVPGVPHLTLSPDQRQFALRLLREGKSAQQIAALFRVHRTTVSRCRKQAATA